MNKFDVYLEAQNAYDKAMDSLEDEIREYIKNNWREDLKFYVEVNCCHVEITVCENIDTRYFEEFIIKRLCEKYDVIISYLELTTSPTYDNYFMVEWGLSKRYEKQS